MLFLCLKGGERMADTTSVGVIQLDVEINPKSLNLEMDKLGKAFNNSFKNMFSGMARRNNNFIKESISNIGNSFRAFAQTGTGSSEKVSKSVSKMNAEYEKTEAKISKIRNELAKLFAEQDAIIKNYMDMPPLTGMSKDESLEHMLKTNPEFNKLSGQIDKLISELDPLVAKNKELAEEIENVGDKADNAGKKFNKMGSSVKKVGKSIFNLSWMKRMFSNESKKATNAASNFGNTMNRVSRMIARNLIVYGLIIKGLKSMISYMWSALKTNQQFAHFLNVIRTNLLVAFQPIYSFVLPALNALMQAVATVTTYIASAISALFGKTYKQSFNSAKAMNKQIEAMEGLGKAAGGAGKKAKKAGKSAKKAGEEAKKALAPFDEINTLDLGKDKDTGAGDIPDVGGGGGGGVPGFEMAMPDMSTIDMSGIEKFKEIMSRIFEPFKLAWENEGQATIDSIKYALTSIGGLIKEIGKSWLEVWTNGTGQAILETILRILQNIFNTIGDIAQSFTRAWVEGGRGTAIMQHLHNIILHVLTLVERLTGAFRTVWGEVGDQLARVFLETLKNILGVFDHLGEKLVWVWDYGGKYLFEGLIKLLAKLIELAGYVINSFIVPFAHGFINIATPAVAVVIKSIGYLLEVFADLIGWMLGKGKPVLDLIITVLGSMAIAFGIVKAAIKAKMVVLAAYQTVMSAAFVMGETFKAGLAAIATPAGIAVVAITAIITIGTLLYKHWDEISVGLKKIWEGIKNTAETIWNSLKEFFSNIWNSIKSIAETTWNGIKKVILDPINQAWTSLKEIWDKIKTYILNKWDEIRQGISNMKNNLVNAIKEPFNIAKNFINGIIRDARDWGRNLISNFVDGIKSMIGKVKDAVSSVASTVKNFLGFSSPTKEGPGSDADKWMPNMIDMFVEGIRSNMAKVSEAIALTAGSIKQGFQPNTNDIASAVGNAVMSAMQVVGKGNNSIDRPIEVNLIIDGNKLGRVVINSINSLQRQSGKTLLEV